MALVFNISIVSAHDFSNLLHRGWAWRFKSSMLWRNFELTEYGLMGFPLIPCARACLAVCALITSIRSAELVQSEMQSSVLIFKRS